tara:strand:- start:102 stop:491 length:390 start_codon:yes stop_codon:yes gene_type:complete
MNIEKLKSKIHRASVTCANLDYVGSLSLDENLMKEANLLEFEKIHVLNITNGNRFVTYVIKATAGTNEVCVNGAAAHLAKEGDLIIVAAYCSLSAEEAEKFFPTIVHVDEKNNIVSSDVITNSLELSKI